MLNLTIGNTTNRKNVTISADTTILEAIESNGFDASKSYTLNGATLKTGEVNKTFRDFGFTERALLISVAKADNALAG